MLGALPVFASMPAVALEAKRAPRTVAELTEAIEGLYAHVDSPSVAAFEEFTVIRADGVDTGAYCMIHGLWAKRGRSEIELVQDAWHDILHDDEGFGSGMLIWRKKPELTVDRPFDATDTDGDLRLRFRFGVLPSDWQQRPGRHIPAWGMNSLEGRPVPWVQS